MLQPITELAAIAHARGVHFHTDAAQAAGKIPIDATAWDVYLLTHRRSQDVRARKASAPCMSVLVYGWSLSSTGVGKNAGSAAERRASPWPSP